MKIYLKAVIVASFINFPAFGQSYSHEYVRPGGSSIMCSTSIRGGTGETQCANVPIDERIKHQQKLLKRLDKSDYCNKLNPALIEDIDNPGHSRINTYSFEGYLKCMGMKIPGIN